MGATSNTALQIDVVTTADLAPIQRTEQELQNLQKELNALAGMAPVPAELFSSAPIKESTAAVTELNGEVAKTNTLFGIGRFQAAALSREAIRAATQASISSST